MQRSSPATDYYGVLGVDEAASRSEIEKQYKREAAKHHPDRGGTEERMKSLNEAYRILRDESARKTYDEQRRVKVPPLTVEPVSSPTASDLGVFGHCLSAGLCLVAGLFLLLLVRFQWIWFLWPLAILAVFVIVFGVLLARSAVRAVRLTLPASHHLRRYTKLQELLFWGVVGCGGYVVYWVLAQ